ncbi:MAG: hypothetical protein JEZ03_07220 [Bacteroidales bacterium]|nr:hypothetical protein [Bacteroidales bacterium]
MTDPLENHASGMSAKIDNQDWKASDYTANVYGNGILISGLSENGESIKLILPNRKVGTYTLTNSENTFAIYKKRVDDIYDYVSTDHPDAGGDITVLYNNTLDSLISGTFNFTAYQRQKNKWARISNGVFKDIPY